MTQQTQPAAQVGETEADAFAGLLAAELPRLVGLATRLLSDPDQAEDCAQETIVGAWRRRGQLRDPAALPAWLRRSLVNRIIDRSRHRHDELDKESYGGGRYLLDTVKGADLGGTDGRLVVDFNYAYNPSCAYDPQWSCPLAPPANRLTVPILAGERYRTDDH